MQRTQPLKNDINFIPPKNAENQMFSGSFRGFKIDVVLVSLLLSFNVFLFSSVSLVDFEQVNNCWVMYYFALQITAKTQNKIPFPKAEPNTNGVDVNKNQGKPPEESYGKNKDNKENTKSEEEKVDTKAKDENTVDKSKVKNDQKIKETQEKEILKNDKSNETKDIEKSNETKDKEAKQADSKNHCEKDTENDHGKEKNDVIESKDKEDDIKNPKKVDTVKSDSDSKEEDLELLVRLTHSCAMLPFYTPVYLGTVHHLIIIFGTHV